MFTHDGYFVPASVPDARVRAALCAAAERAGAVLRASDLLAGAARAGDPRLVAVVQQASRHGVSSTELLAALAGNTGSTGSPLRRDRSEFSPGALRVLDDLERFWQDRRFPGEVALEFLVFSALQHLEPLERQALAVLDLDLLAALLRKNLLQAAGPDAGPVSEETTATADVAPDQPLLLPQELAPSEDLTFRAKRAAVDATFPFDDEPQYDRLFDELCRVLHRQHANHVLLVGERGVGKSTVLAELARRAAVGAIPFLAERRLLSVDCRYVPPDESRDRIAAIFGHVAGHPELVVCLDGFTSLLRSDRPGGNKAALLSARHRADLAGEKPNRRGARAGARAGASGPGARDTSRDAAAAGRGGPPLRDHPAPESGGQRAAGLAGLPR